MAEMGVRIKVDTGDSSKQLDDVAQAAETAAGKVDQVSNKSVKVDASDAVNQLNSVSQAASTAAGKVEQVSNKPVKVDTSYSVKQLQDMADSVNAFTQEIGKNLGKPVKLLNVAENADDLKKLIDDFKEVIRLSTTVRGPLNHVNQGPGNRPLTPVQIDQSLRQDRNYMQAVMTRLMLHNSNTGTRPADVGLSYNELTGRVRTEVPNQQEDLKPKQRKAANDSRFSKIAHSAVQGLGSGGVVGGAMASFARGAEQASAGGLGLAGIVKGGGVAALAYGAFQAVSSGVGAVNDKLDAGKKENIEIDKFRRSLGATTESFEQLRGQSRAVGEQFNLTYEQSRKLTMEFAGLAKTNSPSIASTAIDLAQATGVDESQGIGFMATMRRSGSLSEKAADAKILSIQFAEALKRTGSVLNAGDLMGAMGSFAASTAQRSLGVANVEGFAGLLSAMVGSNTPGLHGNVGNSANILNRADSSFQQGGGMGEASNTLQFMAMGGDRVGLLGVKMRQAAGMFATGDSVFGNKNSQVNKFLRSDGEADMTRFGGESSGLEQVLDMFDRRGVDKKTQLLSASNHFKINPEEMATLFNLRSQHKLTGLTQMFGQYKDTVDLTKLSAHGLMAMSDIQQAGGKPADLMAVRDKMAARAGLTSEQKASLDKAKSITNPKELQDTLVKVANTFEREKTQGEQAQETAAKIEQSTARMADKLIPAALGTKDLLSDLLSWMAPESEQGKLRIEAAKQTARDAFGTNPQAMADRNAFYDRQRKIVGNRPEELARLDAAQKDEMGSYAGQSIRKGMTNDPRRLDGAIPPELNAKMAAIDAELRGINSNWLPGTTQATFMAESSMSPLAVSPAGARGLAQFTPDAQADVEKMAGRKFDVFDPMDAAEMFRLRMRQELKRNPTVEMAQKSYNAGFGNRDKGFLETEKYPLKIAGHRAKINRQKAVNLGNPQAPARIPDGDPQSKAEAKAKADAQRVSLSFSPLNYFAQIDVGSGSGYERQVQSVQSSGVIKPRATGALA